ncbi:helix-turn-helix transcriptional regulator [Streptomyces buecherae]|uniref:helix-turn-helix transcriptional regulator n=1 Tax=Streptomyces buecherae TaxID=2763006 RepID=UPI003664DD92
MNQEPRDPLTFTEVFDLPVAVNLPTAARALGISKGTAYRLARAETFPCPVLRVGGQYRVPTTPLMHALGIEERPVYAAEVDDEDTDADGASGEPA